LHHIGTVATPPREASPALGISQAMSDLVMKALDKNPEQRFQTGEMMAVALESPAVRVQDKPSPADHSSAQIFNTAALAAAAAAPDVDAAPAAQIAKTIRTQTPAVPTVKTAPATAKVEPIYENTLPLGSEYETAKRKRFANWKSHKWALTAAGTIAGALGLWAGISFTQGEAVEAKFVPSNTPAVVERTSSSNSRTSSNRRQPVSTSASPQRGAVDADSRARAQMLTTVGYRRLEKQDFRGAEEAFSNALALDPENSAAQRGLQAARTGATVKGIAGVFGR
jgi:serine/threonine protein kinase